MREPVRDDALFAFLVNCNKGIATLVQYVVKRTEPTAVSIHPHRVQRRRLAHPVFAGQQRYPAQAGYRQLVDAAEVFDDQAGEVEALVRASVRLAWWFPRQPSQRLPTAIRLRPILGYNASSKLTTSPLRKR